MPVQLIVLMQMLITDQAPLGRTHLASCQWRRWFSSRLTVALFNSLEEVEVDFAACGVDLGLSVPVLWSAWLSLVEL